MSYNRMNRDKPYQNLYNFFKLMGYDLNELMVSFKNVLDETITEKMENSKLELYNELHDDLLDKLSTNVTLDSNSSSYSGSDSESDTDANRKKRSYDDDKIIDDRPSKRTNFEEIIVPDCIYGKTLKEATKLIRRIYPDINYTIRPYMVNGKMYGVTCDYVKTRINVILRNNVIVKNDTYFDKQVNCWLG